MTAAVDAAAVILGNAHDPRLRAATRCKRFAALKAAAGACALVVVAGCATFDPPKPWEKGELARPEMQFDPDPLEAKVTQHVYTSKEGASGGFGVGGGGCGCN